MKARGRNAPPSMHHRPTHHHYYQGIKMNKHHITAIAVAVCFACSAGTMAKGMSVGEYKSGKSNIAATYAVAKERCDAYASDARQRCLTDAKARYGKS